MKITESQVRYVASLANLTLSAEEIPKLSQDLSEILTYMDNLNEVDTTGVEPMAQVLYEAEEVSSLRDDNPRPTLGAAAALANAPLSGSGYYKVPKVIER